MGPRTDLPKYEQVKESILSRVQTGGLRPGEQLPSETQLMAEYKVSRHTIRQAVGDLVSEGWLDRRHGSGTFVCRKNGNGKRAALVGVVTTYISEYIFPSIVRGIERYLGDRGYGIVLASTDNQREREPEALELMLGHQVAGLIVEPAQSALPNPNLKPYRYLLSQGIPVVMINGSYHGLGTPAVMLDDFLGGYRLAEHLIGLGHTQIAGIFKGDDFQGVNRERGVLAAMRDHGIEPNPAWFCRYTTAQRETCPSTILPDLVKTHGRPTAVVCYNDQLALQVIGVVESLGLKVPEDLSVTGYDDSPLLASMQVPLTTVVHPQEELGRQAAELLVQCMENGSAAYPRSILYLPRLLVRTSVAPVNSPSKDRMEHPLVW